MVNRVVIDQFDNTVTTDTTSTQNQVLLTPDCSETVEIIENIGGVVTISAPGPQGPPGSITYSEVLTLAYKDPLPSGKPTGSLALSGSGVTFVGMYVYDGTSWIKVSV